MGVADSELACLDHIRFRGVPVSRMPASLARLSNPSLPHNPAIPIEEHELGKRFRIVDDVRGRTRWKIGDILEETEPGPWNVILWRNSAIYLRAAWAKQAWGRLAD